MNLLVHSHPTEELHFSSNFPNALKPFWKSILEQRPSQICISRTWLWVAHHHRYHSPASCQAIPNTQSRDGHTPGCPVTWQIQHVFSTFGRFTALERVNFFLWGKYNTNKSNTTPVVKHLFWFCRPVSLQNSYSAVSLGAGQPILPDPSCCGGNSNLIFAMRWHQDKPHQWKEEPTQGGPCFFDYETFKHTKRFNRGNSIIKRTGFPLLLFFQCYCLPSHFMLMTPSLVRVWTIPIY